MAALILIRSFSRDITINDGLVCTVIRHQINAIFDGCACDIAIGFLVSQRPKRYAHDNSG